jgi:hypothetical protein
MGNLGFQIKRFLSNKNTVTVLGAILIVGIIWFFYNYRIQQAVNPQKMPYAKVNIQPRTRITEDMIGYINVPPAMIKGNVIKTANLIVGKWSNYNTLIPSGSLFFSDTVITAAELPDSAFVTIPENYTAFNLPVTTASTYGNSIFPDNYIDIYFKALNPDGKVIVGKLIANVKVLAVKDKDGRHVFENSEEARTPSIIIFAVPEDMHILLRKALYLANVKEVAAELIPVPTTESYSTDPGSIKITSQYLKTFIEVNTGYITEDQLPDVTDQDNTNNNNNTNP